LQHLPNNDLRKFPSEKKKGLTGAIIFYFILLLILVFIGFKIPPPPEFEEGILVNFGADETGYGLVEPAPMVATSASSPASAPTPVSSPEEHFLTQDDEEAPEVRRVDPDAERRRAEQAAEAARRREEAREAERRRQEEETERRRIEAEQQRQAEIMRNTRDALAGAASTNSSSEGVAGGAGNQGSPTGSVNSNVRGEGGGAGSGVSYSLGGRGSIGALPMPTYNYQEAGIVVVRINVDRAGTVTQATPGVTGSTTLNEDLLRIAREAALKARFTPDSNAPATQQGTITYNFVLR